MNVNLAYSLLFTSSLFHILLCSFLLIFLKKFILSKPPGRTMVRWKVWWKTSWAKLSHNWSWNKLEPSCSNLSHSCGLTVKISVNEKLGFGGHCIFLPWPKEFSLGILWGWNLFGIYLWGRISFVFWIISFSKNVTIAKLSQKSKLKLQLLAEMVIISL